ncbi:hypothetical protein RQP46_011251 [Phenoliferia psychrophenolica]
MPTNGNGQAVSGPLKPGRKLDPTLPLTAARLAQRAFRARKVEREQVLQSQLESLKLDNAAMESRIHLLEMDLAHVSRLLDVFPCSPPAALLLALTSYLRSRSILGPSLSLPDHLSSSPYLSALLAFVALKTANRALNRLTRNHGWKADKPTWGKKGDVVLITGGAGGIGGEMVEILARKGARIAVLDLGKPTYSAEAAKNVKYYKCDVTSPAEIAAVAKQVRADLGHPTVLVNNAGIARGKTILATTMDEYLLTYKVNVLGCHNILREFLPHIISINHGHIMTTASSASYMSIPQLAEYASSKAAVLALHEVLTAELVHRYNAPRVRTSVICPTKVATQMGNAMKDVDHQFLFPTLDPVWLAGRMVAIIESGLSDHLVAPCGAALVLPAIRCMPEWFRWIVSTTGKTHETITDAGNARQAKTYTFVEELDKKHGLPPTTMP